MNNKFNLFVLSTMLCSITNVNANTILSPIAAVASSEFSLVFGINNTINQSGLSSNFVSGVTDFDTYLAINPTHSVLSSQNEWFTPEGIHSAQVNYDLGGIYNIDKLALWNEEASGIGAFNISVSSDNTNFSLLSAGLMPFNNPLDSDYLAEVFLFGSTSARYVRFDITDCPQANSIFDGCGIGEVAFSGELSPIPVPAALPLMASALGAFGLVGRRRNKLS